MIQELIITPSVAQDFLARNTTNRPLRQGLVSTYAADMLKGNWQHNGETIKTSVTGNLLDGQHRLHAIIKANIPVKMLVVTSLPEDSFRTIDTGMRRTAGQILGLSGKHNAAIQASIGRWLVFLESKGTANICRTAVTTQQIFDTLERHPLAAHFASRHSEKGIRSLLASATGAVMVLAAEKYGQDVVDSFLDQFSLGESLKKGDPVYELRERMIQNASRVAKLTTASIVAITIKAMRAYAAQKTIGLLRWSPNEEWPEI